MASSPVDQKIHVLSFVIKVDGEEVPGKYFLKSCDVVTEVNRIPTAKLQFFDGDPSLEKFEINESNFFEPGKEIDIQIGYQSEVESIFKGIIIHHGVKIKPSDHSTTVVKCCDKSIAMTSGRKNAYFNEMKDSDIISGLIGDAGLSADVEGTDVMHKQIVQYYSSDWDFMLSRAEINGKVVTIEDGKVAVKKPDVAASPELKIKFGKEIHRADLHLEADTQKADVACFSWDMTNQEVTEGTSSEPEAIAQGDIDGKKLSDIIHKTTHEYRSSIPVAQDELKAWADAEMIKSRLARIRGTVSFQGSAKAKAGTTIEISGISKSLNGNGYISRVHHQIVQNEWHTECEIGMSPRWYKEVYNDIDGPPASKLLPAISGLQNAKVKQIHEDPDGEARVLVDVPMIEESGEGIWARMVQIYASNEFGAFWYPEVGDEVIVGFLNDDPRYPIIVGKVYSSSKLKPPYTPDEKNQYKAFVTREKMKIEFDDVDKIIIIETPAGQRMTYSDKDKLITIEDETKNHITMDPDGITMESPKEINIKATGDINIESKANISIKATQDVSVEGLNVNLKAKAALKGEGSASAELSAGGTTTVKGAMVMIN